MIKKDITLSDAQNAAVDKAVKNKGSILLAHEMGSGKTGASTAIVEALRAMDRAHTTLVVTPPNLKTNYGERGVSKFTDRSYHDIKGPNDAFPSADYYIISRDLFKRDPYKYLKGVKPDTLVVDEIHTARNKATDSYKALMAARGAVKNCIGMTGTPINNKAYDIVPMLDIISGGNHRLAGGEQAFNQRYIQESTIKGQKITQLNPIHRGEFGHEARKMVHTPVESSAGANKPAVSRTTVEVPMSSEQMKHVDFALQKVPLYVRFMIKHNLPIDRKEATSVFPMLLQARNVMNSTAYLDKRKTLEEAAETTPKMRAVLDDIQDHLKGVPDAQVLAHSHFKTGGVHVLSAGLAGRGIEHGVITGDTPRAEREETINKYNAGKLKVVLLSSAGTTGLDFPNTTLHCAVDGHFNPAVNDQIEARGVRAFGQSHRNPKERKVEIRRYLSTYPAGILQKLHLAKKRHSIDEWVYNTAENKHTLGNQVYEELKKTAKIWQKLM